MSNKVVTRFPPSPTGYFHIGRARTALFNYLYTRQHGGEMIFRIEDTDKERSKKEFEEDLIEGLKWLGIKWDNKAIERQSERTALYQKYLDKIIAEGKAYVSQEKHPETGIESAVVRLKNPNKQITFTDLIRGEITFDTTELGDIIIARSITDPLYHLTVVVDDFEMGITHVIRGEDGISNTPRQILIQEAIGAPRPIYAHLPFILAADRSKLSGRHGAVSVREYREKGYLPEALVNYLALLGWHPPDEQEIFSLEDLVHAFRLEKVQKGGATFDIEKLNWLNREHLKRLTDDEFIERVKPFWPGADPNLVYRLIPELKARITTLADITALQAAGEFDYYLSKPTPTKELLKTTEHLAELVLLLQNIPDDNFTADNIKAKIWDFATEKGRGNVLWPMRVALSGREKSADPFTVAGVLGKNETIARLTHAASL